MGGINDISKIWEEDMSNFIKGDYVRKNSECCFVEIPKYKEPIIGEMAIFWDNDRKLSVCRFFYMINDKGMFLDNSNMPWKNAILFESPEQYKNFLKEK